MLWLRIACVASVGCILAAPARAERDAAFFAPPGPGVPTAVTRRAFVAALAGTSSTLRDLPTESSSQSLKARLSAALDAYRAMRIDAATAELESIAKEAERAAAADLDRRELSNLFLYLGLGAQEQGRAELAWESFIAVARIDSTRTLDPAHVAPRAAASYHRAVAELTRSPRLALTLQVPADAQALLDGEPWNFRDGAASVLEGRHFVSVTSAGYEAWRETVTISETKTLKPELQPVPAPGWDHVGAAPAIVGALYREAASPSRAWAFVVRARRSDGTTFEGSHAFTEADADRIVATLVKEALQERDAPVSVKAPIAPAPRPLVKRWWLWTAVGATVAALAIGVPLGLTRKASSTSGTVGGALEPVR